MNLPFKQLIEELVKEALRGFSLSKFKSLRDPTERIKYASSILPLLGEGSSRIVYAISGSKVLKIAMNEKGFAQNEAEVEIWTNPETRPVVAHIFDAGPNYEWVIAEVVKPLPAWSREMWLQATGMEWDGWSYIVREWIQFGKTEIRGALKLMEEELEEKLASSSPEQRAYSSSLLKAAIYLKTIRFAQKSPWVHGVMKLMEQGLSDADLASSTSVIEHYGKTVDGRLVVLDYGATDEVMRKYYW